MAHDVMGERGTTEALPPPSHDPTSSQGILSTQHSQSEARTVNRPTPPDDDDEQQRGEIDLFDGKDDEKAQARNAVDHHQVRLDCPPQRPFFSDSPTPGAFRARQVIRDSEAETTTDVETNNVSDDHPIVVAHLAPDETDIEARLTVKVTSKITQEVEERLVTKITQEVEERVRQQRQHDSSIVVAAEAEDGVSTSAGVKMRMKWVGLGLLLLVISGVAFWLLYDQTNKKQRESPRESSQAVTAEDPTTAPSMSPSAHPSWSPLLLDPLVEELQSLIIPTEADMVPFLDPTSPQSQALAWLQDDPITRSPGRSRRTVLERYVLAVLYYSTSGPLWNYYQLNDADVCTWNDGSGVNDTEKVYGVFCPELGGSIDALNLYDNNLYGNLPWELVLLTNLISIDLTWNGLTGSIPTRISELTRLESFGVQSNSLTGPLPTTFSPFMSSIDLTDNMFTGTIPEGWGITMPELSGIYMRKNLVTGTLPTSFGQLGNLTTLWVSYNLMSGTIPSELLELSLLQGLFLANNSFTGPACGGLSEYLFVEADCEEVECPCCLECCYDNVRGCTLLWEP